MSEQQPAEDLARQRFIIMTVLRFTGVALAIFGIAIAAGKVDLPPIAGYVFIAVGAFESMILPLLLAKGWSTPRR